MDCERLLKLADFLESKGEFEGRGAPQHKFHLGSWMDTYDSDDFDGHKFKDPNTNEPLHSVKKAFKYTGRKFSFENGTIIKEVQPVECQTAGCAVGWACTIPEFTEGKEFLLMGHKYDYYDLTPGVYYVKNGVVRETYFEGVAMFF